MKNFSCFHFKVFIKLNDSLCHADFSTDRKCTNISRLTLKTSTEHSHIAIHPTTLNRGTPSLLHHNKEPHACLPVRKLSTPCTDFLEAPSTITDLNMFVDGSSSKKKTYKLPRKLYSRDLSLLLKYKQLLGINSVQTAKLIIVLTHIFQLTKARRCKY